MACPAPGSVKSCSTPRPNRGRRRSDDLPPSQGPPGTGKTYCAAHLVHTLIGAKQRVGITATSHSAINSLLEAIIAVFEEACDRDVLRAVRNAPADSPRIDGVTYGN